MLGAVPSPCRYADGAGPCSSSCRERGLRRGSCTPSCSAFASFEPGLSPDHDVARLLRHAARDLARRAPRASACASSRVIDGKVAGEHEGQARRATAPSIARRRRAGPCEVDARGAQLLDQLAVALDARRTRCTLSAMIAADAVARRRAPRPTAAAMRVEAARARAASACGRGRADVADAEPDEQLAPAVAACDCLDRVDEQLRRPLADALERRPAARR